MEVLLKSLCSISVVLYPLISTTSQTDNAALFKEARQSTYYGVYFAKLGIDGRREADGTKGSCSQTSKQTNPWWQVDLLVPIAVSEVHITNRLDCCHERLDGAEIRIGNDPANNGNSNPRCALISRIAAGQTQTYPCGGMKGRYVNVIIPGESRLLALCEVEVQSVTPEYTHIRGLLAAQSSLYFSEDKPMRAVDGVRTTVYPESCTSTAWEKDPWLRADLRGLFMVTAVTITNRGDCCSERLDGAEIRVGYSLANNGRNNPRCATVAGIAAGKSHYFLCVGMLGRYVTVVIPGPNKVLTLCEVDVFGFPAVNVAQSGTASQSSSYGSSSPQVAIDGNKKPPSCIQTSVETAPWWRVDLGADYRFTAISVTNGDTNPEWLDNAEICIGNTPDLLCQTRCVVISHIAAGQTQTFPCDGMDGRYVTVSIPGDDRTLQLCEVEVYGVTLDTFSVTTVPPPTTTPLPPATPTPPPTPTPTPAPSASVQLGGRTVTLVGERLCWSDALFYCRDRQLELLSLGSEEEQRGLEELLEGVTFPLTSHLWLGLRRRLQGNDWFWMSGHHMTYSHWLSGPPPAHVSRPCGALANTMDFLWQDRPCKEHLNFLCFSGANEEGVTRVDFYSSYRN